MKSNELREIRLLISELEAKLAELQNNAQVLDDNSVDTSTSDTLRDQQEELQDEAEQLVSNILAILDQSDSLDEFDLPLQSRRPVEAGDLPAPNIEWGNGNAPPWAGGKGSNPGNGQN